MQAKEKKMAEDNSIIFTDSEDHQIDEGISSSDESICEYPCEDDTDNLILLAICACCRIPGWIASATSEGRGQLGTGEQVQVQEAIQNGAPNNIAIHNKPSSIEVVVSFKRQRSFSSREEIISQELLKTRLNKRLKPTDDPE